MPELPSGTVTFLFTDVEDSTRLWESDRQGMQTPTARQLRIVREAVERCGGALYKTVGDGTQSAFASAPNALAAALAAQRAIAMEPWPASPGPLRLHMALHTGEAAPDDRGDYLAPALNRLSRLLASGSGGQILLTQAVQLLVRDALPTGAALRDLGEHGLRDLLEPERVFQLLHPDLPADFPALKTLAARPTNLPAQPTSFLGREHEVKEIVDLVRAGTRLVTLTGPGGTGKTRLAVQVATDLLDAFPDGVFFVPLASLTDPARVPAAIAEALRIREEGSQPLQERLYDFLARKHLLLVLDNVEHVVAAAPDLARLMELAPRVTLLATSRVPLRLRGEREYAVPPLGLPPRHPLLAPDRLAQFEAVRLFVERAQAVRPDFALDHANAAAVAEVCHRLDGLPLAIELAAARVRILSPQAMLARFEKRLPLLTSGARDAPQRQRTLRDTIAWSHDLLKSEEQTLFRRLAVFAGGATFEAVETVANPGGDLDALGSLERLVEHSLVRQTDGAGAEPRYVMLETIREYGLELLEAAAEVDASRQRLTDFLLAIADRAAPKLRGREQLMWLDRLEAEHANLRAALDWALVHDANAALTLAADLGWFWHYRGFVTEGRTWLDRALARDPGPPSAKRTAALLAAAALAEVQAAVDCVAALAAEALAAAERAGDLASQAHARLLLGFAARDRGSPEEGHALLEEARGLARRAGDHWTEAHCCLNLAGTPWNHGDYPGAAELLEESLAAAEASGDVWLITRARSVLGLLASEQGDPGRAIALLEPSLAQQRVNQDRIGAMSSLLWLGTARRRNGVLARAEEHLTEGLATAQELGDVWHIAANLAALGEVALARGSPRQALTFCRDALRTASAAHLVQSWQVRGLAAALVAADRAEAGARLLGAESCSRNRLHELLVPADKQSYDNSLALARANLGGQRFDAAWKEGDAAVRIEDAIADALAVADGLIAESAEPGSDVVPR